MNQCLAEKGTATLEPGAFARRWQDPARFLQILDDPWFKIVVGIQNLVSVATMDFWRRRDCITLHLPITTNAISSPMGLGSDSLPVEIDLFGQRTYLADSMQFMLEYGCRFHPEGCYYVMPSFRGESADETHLSQFYHSEAELCLGLEDQIDVAESYFRYVTQAVLERFQGELGTAGIGTSHLDVILCPGRANFSSTDVSGGGSHPEGRLEIRHPDGELEDVEPRRRERVDAVLWRSSLGDALGSSRGPVLPGIRRGRQRVQR